MKVKKVTGEVYESVKCLNHIPLHILKLNKRRKGGNNVWGRMDNSIEVSMEVYLLKEREGVCKNLIRFKYQISIGSDREYELVVQSRPKCEQLETDFEIIIIAVKLPNKVQQKFIHFYIPRPCFGRKKLQGPVLQNVLIWIKINQIWKSYVLPIKDHVIPLTFVTFFKATSDWITLIQIQGFQDYQIGNTSAFNGTAFHTKE